MLEREDDNGNEQPNNKYQQTAHHIIHAGENWSWSKHLFCSCHTTQSTKSKTIHSMILSAGHHTLAQTLSTFLVKTSASNLLFAACRIEA